MYTPHEPEFSKDDISTNLSNGRKGSGPLPPLEEIIGKEVHSVLPKKDADALDTRFQQNYHSIAQIYVPSNQCPEEWEKRREHIIPRYDRLEAILKNRSQERLLSKDSLLYLLSSPCISLYPEQYDRHILLAFLMHPSANKEVYRTVFSFATDDFLRPNLLKEIFFFDHSYSNDVVKAFLEVMEEKFPDILSSFQVHVSAWTTLACAGEWREEDIQKVYQGLEGNTTLRQMFDESLKKDLTTQGTPASLARREGDSLEFIRKYIQVNSSSLPVYFVQGIIEYGMYDEHILNSLDPSLVCKISFQLLSTNALEASEHKKLWEEVIPFVLVHLSTEKVLEYVKVYLRHCELHPQDVTLITAHPDTYRPLLGMLLVSATERGDVEYTLHLLPVMYTLTQISGRGALTGFIWKVFRTEFVTGYKNNTLSPRVRETLQLYLYEYLFEEECIKTFEDLTELYDVLPDASNKVFQLLSLFIRSGVDRTALQSLDTYFSHTQWRNLFTDEERQELLKKITGVV